MAPAEWEAGLDDEAMDLAQDGIAMDNAPSVLPNATQAESHTEDHAYIHHLDAA